MTVKYFKDETCILAVLIQSNFTSEGISFFTNRNDPQQLGYMNRPKDYVIKPHRHKIISRTVERTNEVLYIKSGCVRLDLKDQSSLF